MDVHNTRLWELAHIMKAVAAQRGVKVVDQFDWVAQNYATAAHLPDGIHPSDWLYAAKGWLQYHVLKDTFAAHFR